MFKTNDDSLKKNLDTKNADDDEYIEIHHYNILILNLNKMKISETNYY